MRLTRVWIRNFRSIEMAYLPSLGPVTALIGKNNSGKSNTLYAIRTALQCISEGGLVGKIPNSATPVDEWFFNRQSENGAEIWLQFHMQPTEATRLGTWLLQSRRRELEQNGLLTVSIKITTSNKELVYFISNLFVGGFSCTEPATPRPDGDPIFRLDENLAKRYYRTPSDDKLTRQRISNLKMALEMIPRFNNQQEGQPFQDWLVHNLPDDVMTSVRWAKDPLPNLPTDLAENIRSVISHLTANLTRHQQVFKDMEESVPDMSKRFYTALSNKVRFLWEPEHRQSVSAEDAKALFNMKNRREHKPKFSRVGALMQQLYGIDVDAFGGDESPATVYLGDFLAAVNGSGVRESLKILTDIELYSPPMVLIEEPEVYLHPKAQLDLFAYLKDISRHTQVLLTTHSPSFVDHPSVTTTYLVTKATSTTARILDSDSMLSLVSDLGLRYSQVFFRDALIFVEGAHDRAILHSIASRVGCDLTSENLEFVLMGGSRNIWYYASRDILESLSRHQIRYHFILDRDERTDEDIRKLEDSIGKENITVLRRREIENYLINPPLIQRFTAIKGKEPPSLEIIENRIAEVAESLRGLVTAKRLAAKALRFTIDHDSVAAALQDPDGVAKAFDRLLEQRQKSLQHTRIAIPDLLVTEEELLRRNWDPYSSPPGDELLDQVCQTFGVRFLKDRHDGEKMAMLMEPGEVPEDLVNCLKKLKALGKL